MNKNKQPENLIQNKPLYALELKANLNPQQREHLEMLKAKMKKVLGGKAKQELAKAGDLASLKKYKAILGEILQFLKTKEINDNKKLSFETMEELEAVYSPEQIAHKKDEVGEDTKVYIGELYPGIFKELPKDIEHIYTSFPEGKIMQKEITIGGKSAKQLQEELLENGYKLTARVKARMNSNDFKTVPKKEKLTLVGLYVEEMGFPKGATREKIYSMAQKLGLEILPPEVGPQLRLQYNDQPVNEWLNVGSEPISVASSNSEVFDVKNIVTGKSIDADHWGPYGSANQWVFGFKSAS